MSLQNLTIGRKISFGFGLIFALLIIVAAIAFRIGLRRLPVIRAMARHIDAAKAQAKAAQRS